MNYLVEGDKPKQERQFQSNETVENYKTNVYEIVRFLIEYGFIPPLLEIQVALEKRKSFGAFWQSATSSAA